MYYLNTIFTNNMFVYDYTQKKDLNICHNFNKISMVKLYFKCRGTVKSFKISWKSKAYAYTPYIFLVHLKLAYTFTFISHKFPELEY
jgi:hypothetical protein